MRSTAWSACFASVGIAFWDPRSVTGRSSTTTSTRQASFRSAGPTGRTAAATGSSVEPTRLASATRSGRTPGSVSCSRRASALWRASRNGDGATAVEEEPLDETPLAFIGVRSCELHAIEIQDRVFIGGKYVDRDYAARRDGAFLVAVNCFEPGGTCFCTSMGTGPKVESGYDLALTELLDGEHRFLVEAGSDRGARAARRVAAAAGRRRRPHRGRSVGRAQPRQGWAARWRRTTSATCLRETSSIRAGTTSPSAASRAATARSSAPRASAPRSRTRPTSPARRRSAGGSGTSASRSTTRTSTAAASGRPAAPATGSG